MSFDILEDSLEAAQDAVIAVFNQTRKRPSAIDRYDWLYRRNPDGKATLWTIRTGGAAEVVGFTVALPRRMLVDGQSRICWNGADFSILPRYRTLGLAMKLRRLAKEGVDGGRVDFLYAHPNERMAVIHGKVGHQPIGRMLRYAKVLRTAPYLRDRGNSALLARVAGCLLDPVLRFDGRQWRHQQTFEVRAVDRPEFSDRYDHLFADTPCSARVIGVRDGRYLDWRYRENPLYETHSLEAREGNQLRGYLLYRIDGETAMIKDVFPPDDSAVVRDLVAAMIREGRRRGLRNLSVVTLEGNPIDVRFAEFGFRRRPETSEMYAYAPAGCMWRGTVLDKTAWFLTVGDRDV